MRIGVQLVQHNVIWGLHQLHREKDKLQKNMFLRMVLHVTVRVTRNENDKPHVQRLQYVQKRRRDRMN